MATHTGKDGVVQVGSVSIAEVVSFEFTESAKTVEDSALTDAADTYLAGSTSFNGSLSCWWDESDTTGQGALTVGASVTLVLNPEGIATGDTIFTGSAIITGISRKVARNAIVSCDFTFQGSGALTSSTHA